MDHRDILAEEGLGDGVLLRFIESLIDPCELVEITLHESWFLDFK